MKNIIKITKKIRYDKDNSSIIFLSKDRETVIEKIEKKANFYLKPENIAQDNCRTISGQISYWIRQDEK